VASGAIAGLATVTPASGFVTPSAGIVIGMAASVICYAAAVLWKPRFGYDDSLDAFGVHGVGGFLGTLAVGIFASKAINPAGADGLLRGNAHQLGVQALAALATLVYAFVVTLIIYKAVDVFMGVRVHEKDEDMGLDLTQHRERAYTILE
jgi:Amt family ammonium transporter